MNELEDLFPDAWTTDIYGCAVRRADAIEEVAGAVRDRDGDMIVALIEAITSDKRASFSKAKILELIEENDGSRVMYIVVHDQYGWSVWDTVAGRAVRSPVVLTELTATDLMADLNAARFRVDVA